jgi:hypothetical protein
MDYETALRIWETSSLRSSLRGSEDVDLEGLYALLVEA